jgi:hypothetical protein
MRSKLTDLRAAARYTPGAESSTLPQASAGSSRTPPKRKDLGKLPFTSNLENWEKSNDENKLEKILDASRRLYEL